MLLEYRNLTWRPKSLGLWKSLIPRIVEAMAPRGSSFSQLYIISQVLVLSWQMLLSANIVPLKERRSVDSTLAVFFFFLS